MKIYQHDGQWLIEIHKASVLFREIAGLRYVIAMGHNIPALREHASQQTEAGGYYIADHGTYSIHNAATAEAMASLSDA